MMGGTYHLMTAKKVPGTPLRLYRMSAAPGFPYPADPGESPVITSVMPGNPTEFWIWEVPLVMSEETTRFSRRQTASLTERNRYQVRRFGWVPRTHFHTYWMDGSDHNSAAHLGLLLSS